MGAPLTWSPCLAVLEGHRGPVNCAAFSPDGLIVVSGSSDRHLILWDTRTGAPIGNILPEGGSSVCCLAFSPDGKRIAWATDDGTLCQFDPVTLAVIGPPMTVTLGKATGLLFSPDSTRIITYIEWSTDSPLCWDAVSGTVIGNLLKDPCEESVGTMRFSPDGKLLVTGSQASAKILLWDAIEGTLLRTIGDLKYGNDYTSTLLGFSEDCKNILQYSYQTGTLRLWDAETGSSKGKWLLGDDSHTAIAFSLAGDRAATSVDGRTQLWDATSADAIGEPLSGHTSKINSIHFSPTGKQFVSCSKDGTLRLWEATLVPGARRSDPDMGEISVIIVSPNRERVIAGSYGKILRLWDTRSGNPVGIDLKAPWPGFVTSAAFSPDSSRIALGCSINVVRLWDAVLGQPIGDPLRLGDGSTNEVDAVTFSTSGRLLATAPTYGRIKIWDLESRLQTGATMDGGLGSVDFLCFSADETQLISRGAPSTWRLWDLATTTLAKELSGRSGYGSSGRFRHEYDLSSCEFSPDGKKIIGTLKTSQFLYWDRHTGALTEPSEESRRADKPKDVYRSNGSGWIRDTSGRILFWVPAENRGQMFRVDLEYGLIVTTGYGGQLTVMRFQPSTRPRGDVEPAVS
jgi:WD40 repeat protein